MKHTLFACLVVAGAASCVASTEMPKQAQIGAHAALQAADNAVEPHRPMQDAEQYLELARQDVQTGDRKLATGDDELARLYFERAQGEADVAIAKARAKAAEKQTASLQTGGGS